MYAAQTPAICWQGREQARLRGNFFARTGAMADGVANLGSRWKPGPSLLLALAPFATVAADRLRTIGDPVGGALLSHSFPRSASKARAFHSAAIARMAEATSFLTASAAH